MPLIHVFDLGNVLLFVNGHVFFDRLRARCRPCANLEQRFNEHYERSRLDRGGDFTALHHEVVRDLDLDMDLAEFTHIWNDIFAPNPPMLEVVKRIPRPRYLLSNTNAPHVEWIRDRYPDIFPLFDHCVFSNEAGCRKPDPAIYRRIESLTGRPPQDHIFVDDIPDFVSGAQAVGWQAIQFVGVEDYLQRLATLEKKRNIL